MPESVGPSVRRAASTTSDIGASVVVLGMHRSGTSLLARVVNLLGLSVGDQDDLSSGPGSPDGHWESNSLIRMNHTLLAAFGGYWYAPPEFTPGWERTRRARVLLADASATFDRAYATVPWVWKDPRTCLTLPFWRQILRTEVVHLLVWRNPIPVAASLKKRDGYALELCLALWERYTRQAIANCRTQRVVVADYDLIVRSPASISQLAHDLSSLGVAITGDLDRAAGVVVAPDEPFRTPDSSALSAHQRQLLDDLSNIRGAHRSLDVCLNSEETPGLGRIFESVRPHGYYTAARMARRILPSTLRSVLKLSAVRSQRP